MIPEASIVHKFSAQPVQSNCGVELGYDSVRTHSPGHNKCFTLFYSQVDIPKQPLGTSSFGSIFPWNWFWSLQGQSLVGSFSGSVCWVISVIVNPAHPILTHCGKMAQPLSELYYQFFSVFIFVMPGIGPRTSHRTGKHPTSGLHARFQIYIF